MPPNIQDESSSDEKVITTMCNSHCGGCCMLKVHVRGGVITHIETDDGQEPQLRACAKGRAYRQRVYAPDRLLYPLRRVGQRGEGEFEHISWDENKHPICVTACPTRAMDVGPVEELIAKYGDRKEAEGFTFNLLTKPSFASNPRSEFPCMKGGR